MIVPEYFRDDELVCHCGCGLLPPSKSIERLYAVRIVVRHPFPVSSAARCKAHNKAVGGAIGSLHLPEDEREGDSAGWGGCGFDIVADPDLQAKIYAVGLSVGFTGFGFADTWVHIDDGKRPKITTWKY